MEKQTQPCPPPEPALSVTWDPRESITWPRGWVDALGVHRRVLRLISRREPFGCLATDGSWQPTSNMGPLPHARAGR